MDGPEGERSSFSIIEDVGRIISTSTNADQTLQEVVHLVAGKLTVDVCSIYLLERDRHCLTLVATVGLNPDAVGRICMNIDEGLAGLVLEESAPLLVQNPSCHPRHKYFRDSGEERFCSFLGLPLIYHGEMLGVLVVQTERADALQEKDIPVFSAIASQIAGAAAYAVLLRNLKRTEEETAGLKERLQQAEKARAEKKEKKKGPLRGIAVSPGFAEGYAYFYRETLGFTDVYFREIDNIPLEITRFEAALKEAENQIFHIFYDFQEELSPGDAAIFQAYLMYLRDGGLKKRVIDTIRKGYAAEYALKETVLEYTNVFSRIEDPYLRERGHDIEIVGKRILDNLLGFNEEIRTFKKKTILVAANISPAELIRFRQENLRGIILTKGGETSHVTILARSFEIPMVIGVPGIQNEVREDGFLIVDGTSGYVFPHPTRLVIREYQRLESEKVRRNERLDGLKTLPAETLDGFHVRMGANIGLLSDLDLVDKYGADHIGLYRTEFPFLSRARFPSEDEQAHLYRRILKGAGGRQVTIRTLDVGGDKFLAYMDYPKEDNPYLGWRSIRVSLELTDIFREQIRAILRASTSGPLQILFPMITSVTEIREILSILEQEKEILSRQGIPFDPDIPAGILVEVPAAAAILESLLKYVAFVSIGTNDLIQYVLAVDRNNQKVAPLYNPLHPAVIATIARVASICRERDVPVGICGESAADPRLAYLYMGMGIDRLSMNAAAVPVVKDLLRKVKRSEAEEALREALRQEEATDIARLLDERIGPLVVQA
ncbi:MAG: phosphoenolpyruvate--protein phosphotransferase [Syntrophales bacterium]